MTKNDSYMEHVRYGVLSTKNNWDKIVKSLVALNKGISLYDGLNEHDFFNSCWLLDGNAFEDMPAPKFMKLDAITLGGLEVLALMPTEKTNPELVKELKSSSLPYTPIGFLDLHHISEGSFSTSGLGVAKPYQNNGLSKHIIAAASQIAGIKDLIIPTQLSNAKAHKAWMHLAPLKILSANVPHEKPDTVIYEATIPENILDVLRPLGAVNDEGLIPFDKIKSQIQSLDKYTAAYATGYSSGGLNLKYEIKQP